MSAAAHAPSDAHDLAGPRGDARDRFFADAAAYDVDMSVTLGSLRLRNPVMPASGCFGPELAPLVPMREVGASVTKTVFSGRRGGNPAHRLTETSTGMINSVGIPSLGTPTFLRDVLPRYRALGAPVVVSLGGLTVAEYLTVAEELTGAELAETEPGGTEIAGTATTEPPRRFEAVEVNVSCPNLEGGGLEIGTDPAAVAEVVAGVAARVDVPVLVKLTPMVSSIEEVAHAAAEAGAAGLTVANSFPGMVLDRDTRRPVLGNRVGGVSGPAVKPLALRLAWTAARAVDIPVIGCGGIETADDALDFLAAGAAAVQIGTAHFTKPYIMVEIIRELAAMTRAAGETRLTDYVQGLGRR
ncbi:dihydroorotate dehydrogenase (NAD+) catalytic subunit [Actinoalloteichus hoggarensis]|uniref:Dihydroorotate dehydrogenase n=1 Tax=Actinoalloteichus hoggarensis TaxID=1470176 RepID=A0A221W7X7_9PSEU|nr:nitronate monooxygenase [Actinoalloteichus hoggarensis]ASO21995.1 Dihydroorotate dehydrogenase B (NAD(+)), catalytic subunit [Actinoalloteichus hoggarensis]MBB5923925.1 dihydroorotate dehydrogenase (NAD+) catalytic subunit [Actinoalloteichus hoggarensis]